VIKVQIRPPPKTRYKTSCKVAVIQKIMANTIVTSNGTVVQANETRNDL